MYGKNSWIWLAMRDRELLLYKIVLRGDPSSISNSTPRVFGMVNGYSSEYLLATRYMQRHW